MKREAELLKQIETEVSSAMPAVLKAIRGLSPVVAMNVLHRAMQVVASAEPKEAK